MEEQADNFAVMQSGKEAMIGFLEFLLRTCPTGGKLGWNEIGNRELQIRIAEQPVTKKAQATMISFFAHLRGNARLRKRRGIVLVPPNYRDRTDQRNHMNQMNELSAMAVGRYTYSARRWLSGREREISESGTEEERRTSLAGVHPKSGHRDRGRLHWATRLFPIRL